VAVGGFGEKNAAAGEELNAACLRPLSAALVVAAKERGAADHDGAEDGVLDQVQIDAVAAIVDK